MEISTFKDMFLAELQELLMSKRNWPMRCCAWREPLRIRY